MKIKELKAQVFSVLFLAVVFVLPFICNVDHPDTQVNNRLLNTSSIHFNPDMMG